MDNEEKLQEIAMHIIANSGAARGCVFEAMTKAKEGNFAEAEELLKKGEEYYDGAHTAHRQLLKLDAKGEVEKMTVLLTHAQDHLMNSVLAGELLREIIELHKIIKGGETK